VTITIVTRDFSSSIGPSILIVAMFDGPAGPLAPHLA